MRRILAWLAGVFPALALCAAGAQAGTTGAIYNMQRLLSQPHPFARPYAPAAPGPGVLPRAMPAPGQPVVDRAPEAPAPPPAPAQAARPDPLLGIENVFSEVRLGALWHDQGPFSSNKESGFDSNVEVLFVSPDVLGAIGSPRPHVGLSVNSAGDTSQAYLGLSWEWEFWEGTFAGFSLGGAVHDGKKRTEELDRKELGCRVLFHESIDVGYRFDRHHGVMLHLEHSSNSKLCSTNEGLENFGIRYGYRF